MKRTVVCFIFLLIQFFSGSLLYAEIPKLINYQGTITDASGPISGSHSLTFRIYSDSLASSPLWVEAHSAVDISYGLFNVLLGSIVNIPDGLFVGSLRWIGVSVDSDPEISPRMRIASVPWAFRAAIADTALRLAAPIDRNSLDAADGDPMHAVFVDTVGNVGIGTENPAGKLEVQGGNLRVIVNDDEVRFLGDADTWLYWHRLGALASGHNAHAWHYGTVALGEGATALNWYSLALGWNTYTEGIGSIAIGNSARAKGTNSIAIGVDVETRDETPNVGCNIVLGSGHGIDKLINNVSYSLMVGFNTTVPTLFVGGPSERVGIGTTSPQEKLQINGALKLGNTTASNSGTIRWNGSDFEGFNGTAWKSFTAGSSGLVLPYDGWLNLDTPGFQIHNKGIALHGESYGTSTHAINGFASGDGSIGVLGHSAGSDGNGVYGFATGSNGVAVVAIANQSNGTGLYAEGGSSGYAGEFNGTVYSSSGGFKFPDGTVQTTAATGGGGGGLTFPYLASPSTSSYAFTINNLGSGGGIKGTTSSSSADAAGVYGYASDGGASTHYGGYFLATGSNSKGVFGTTDGTYGISVEGFSSGSNGYAGFFRATGTNASGIYAEGGASGYAAKFKGNVLIQKPSDGTTLIELGEGLDYAEGFDISDAASISPGCVLVIDPHASGKLMISSEPYDKRVAGIVAGAKGLGSGVRLGSGNFDHSVALAGRVYCNVDASEEGIEPGDLLTTSAEIGHAMKVVDFKKARGAILGKAMEQLPRGKRGQILVLVTLQ